MLNTGPPAGPLGGRQARLVLGRGRGALVHAVGRLAGDRAARGRDRGDARRPRPARRPADRGRRHAGRARRRDLRPDRGGRGRPRARSSGVRGGRLRVASFPSAGATLMPLAVATFRRGHPDVALTLAEGEPEEIAPRLRAGEFDLALLFEFPGVRERPGKRAPHRRRCSRTRCTWRCPADHRLASKPALRLADLRERGLGPDLGVEPVRAARRAARAWPPGSSRT